MRSPNEVLEFAKERLSSEEKKCLLQSITKCEEAIIFGSFATGHEGPSSDLDILLVGNGKKIKTRNLEILWVDKNKLFKKTWLTSELASHVAKYGLWLKGDGNWRNLAAIGSAAITRKKIKILTMLAHIYLKKNKLRTQSLYNALDNVFLDVYRLKHMIVNMPVPPTAIIIDLAASNGLVETGRLFIEIFGKIGTAYLDEIFGIEIWENHGYFHRVTLNKTRLINRRGPTFPNAG